MDTSTDPGPYDEALERLHGYGPEFDGYLSNHGPMVVEALGRRGAGADIHRWTDAYTARLDGVPRALGRIDDWREALGRRDRAGEWITHLDAEVAEHGWAASVRTWVPRLLPGIAGGATHGVIRLGHAVSAVASAESAPRVTEVSRALAYWATCWLPTPVVAPRGRADPAAALERLPVVPQQEGGIRDRLAQLPETDGYAAAAAELRAPGERLPEIVGSLERLVDAAVAGYAGWAPGNPTMLVHAATAPHAVLRLLPALPERLAPIAHDAAWAAATAVVASYRPEVAGTPGIGPAGEEAFAAAVAHGSEHVIKLADTAVESWRRTGDDRALAAIGEAIRRDA